MPRYRDKLALKQIQVSVFRAGAMTFLIQRLENDLRFFLS